MLITKAVFSTSVLLAVALQVTPAWAAQTLTKLRSKRRTEPIGYWRRNETSGTTASRFIGKRKQRNL